MKFCVAQFFCIKRHLDVVLEVLQVVGSKFLFYKTCRCLHWKIHWWLLHKWGRYLTFWTLEKKKKTKYRSFKKFKFWKLLYFFNFYSFFYSFFTMSLWMGHLTQTFKYTSKGSKALSVGNIEALRSNKRSKCEKVVNMKNMSRFCYSSFHMIFKNFGFRSNLRFGNIWGNSSEIECIFDIHFYAAGVLSTVAPVGAKNTQGGAAKDFGALCEPKS